MRLRRIAFASVVAVSAALLAVFLAARWHYSRPFDRFCYEITIAFSAEGVDFILMAEAVTEFYRWPPIAYGGVSIVRRPKWIGKRLPSGAAVIFSVPFQNMSALIQHEDDGRPGPDVLPYAFWLDDSRAPSRMEGYISELAYGNPASRIGIKAMSARRVSECTPANPAEEILWFGMPRQERYMSGFYADVVPEEEWRKFPTVAPILEPLTRFTALPDDAVDDLSLAPLLAGNVPKWQGPTEVLSVAGHPFAGRPTRDRPEHEFVRPVVVENGAFALLLDQAGKVVYYTERPTAPFDLRIGTRSEPVTTSDWYFDPVTRMLFRLHDVTL